MATQVQLTAGLLDSGSRWLAGWSSIPQPPPKKWDMPPMGAAGEAVITLQWTAEWALFAANLAAKRDAGQLTPEQLLIALAQGPVWKEMGSRAAVDNAAQLPPKYRGVEKHLLYVRWLIRRAYHDARPARATTTWQRPTGGEGGPVDLMTDWLGLPATGAAPQAAGWLVVVTMLGIAGIAAKAWYESKNAEAGVAIEAERAFAMAQAWQNVKIAAIQAASGQDITVPEFVSRGAAIEKAQSSTWTIVGAAGIAAVATGSAVTYALTRPRRSNPRRAAPNPKRRRRRRKRNPPALAAPKRPNPPAKAANPKRRKKRRKNPKHAPNPTRKRKRAANPKRKTERDRFIRSQKSKGRTEKQAAATWKAMRAMRKARKKKR